VADEQQDERQGAQQGAGGRLAGGIESTTGPAGAGAGVESVDIDATDVAVGSGPRQESGSATDAGDYEGGAEELGGTGGANAGGAG
jgi:hypothetical protein